MCVCRYVCKCVFKVCTCVHVYGCGRRVHACVWACLSGCVLGGCACVCICVCVADAGVRAGGGEVKRRLEEEPIMPGAMAAVDRALGPQPT